MSRIDQSHEPRIPRIPRGAELLPPDLTVLPDAAPAKTADSPSGTVLPAQEVITLIPAVPSRTPQTTRAGLAWILGLPNWMRTRWRRRPILSAAVVLTFLLAVSQVTVLAARVDFGPTWRTIAGAVGWIPTATAAKPPPSPTPSWNTPCNRPEPPPPPPYSYPAWAPEPPKLPAVPVETVRQLITQTFGACAHDALIIAHCESGFGNDAWNQTPVLSSHAAGVFQILWKATWDRTVYENDNAFDAKANIAAAYAIFAYDGNQWFEWETAKCLPDGCSWCRGTG